MNIEDEIKKLGWSQWYNPNAWVNSRIFPDDLKKVVDPTKYPVSAEDGYKISTDETEKEKYFGTIKIMVQAYKELEEWSKEAEKNEDFWLAKILKLADEAEDNEGFSGG